MQLLSGGGSGSCSVPLASRCEASLRGQRVLYRRPPPPRAINKSSASNEAKKVFAGSSPPLLLRSRQSNAPLPTPLPSVLGNLAAWRHVRISQLSAVGHLSLHSEHDSRLCPHHHPFASANPSQSLNTLPVRSPPPPHSGLTENHIFLHVPIDLFYHYQPVRCHLSGRSLLSSPFNNLNSNSMLSMFTV